MNLFKKTMLISACAAMLGGVSLSAQAANWLMLQGTEPRDAAPRAKLWGFIQAQYQKDNSDPSDVPGGYIPPKLIGPKLESQEAFNVNRARIGVRGQGMPLDGNVNYFILAELGYNGITAANNGGTNITDASVTLNHIDGARVRMGLFKTPGFEEGLQAIHVFDYINFTSAGNQLMLERHPADSDTVQPPIPDANMNAHSTPVGAFRDVGIQVFDAFRNGDWEHSYAVMYGNGNGLNGSDNDENKDTYVYLSSEKIFGGRGPRREGLKIFAWYQDGKRTNVYDPTEEQDRTRSGAGVKYLKKPFRVTAEYLTGEGMIFQGQHRPTHYFNDEEADGYYIDLGWYIPGTNWELDLRYDSYTRGENHPTSAASDESRFDTTTIGAQYHINKKTRVNMEYSSRDFESDTTAVDNQLLGVDSRLAVQLTHIF
ncbi:porin [Thiohalophilus sp.]|uniref:porin n=1 Tax=Thiohalophilus sp. TaxID=3028392 RepID=UPI002ACE8C1B|nr:porin [Thiohalophilus sp.]MDZ7661236.1 porin [Thiohalophilus sp.]